MTAKGSTSGVLQPRALAQSSAVRPVEGSRTVTSARPSVASRAAHSRKPWRAATSSAVCRSALTLLMLRPRRRNERIRMPMATSLPTYALWISGVLPERTQTHTDAPINTHISTVIESWYPPHRPVFNDSRLFGISRVQRFFVLVAFELIFTCVSYAEARNRYRLDVCLSVRPSVPHTLVLYKNG